MADGTTPPVTVMGDRPAARLPGIVALFRPHAPRLFLGFVWLLLTNTLLLAVPRLVNEGIAVVEGTRARGASLLAVLGLPTDRLGPIVALIGACALLGAMVRVASRVVLFNVGRDVERELRTETFAHLATLSPSFYRQHNVGDLMSRLTGDMTNVRLLSGFALLNALNTGIVFAATLPIVFSLDARVAALALAPFPFVILGAQLTSRRVFKRTREVQDALGRLTSRVQENLAGQSVVRAFSHEAAEERSFALRNEELRDKNLRLAKARLSFVPIGGLGALGTAAALWAGGDAVVGGRLDVGDVVELSARVVQLAWPMVALGLIISVIQRGRASLSRIHELLRARPDIVDGPVDALVQGGVEARALCVEVAPGVLGLRGVDVRVEPGRVLGIVGKNGSGKSTLLRALARQLPCPRGQLLLDGVDVNDWHLRALHAGVGVVPEDAFLFSDTLRDNLAFGRPDATAAEIEAVVDLCDLRRDVRALPEGLGTLVGERGVTLSGGQRQRAALARAILSRPALLLLDDCLSAVDAETEAHIVTALRRGFVGADGSARAPTLIVVSHRLSAVREADEILVLDSGAVLERGRHEALLAAGGLYAELWGREQRRRALGVST
ncbi:MAG: ABC transporter ATP-binding protein [Deltaproteobacteria bacterium]|nr:ABC transporter ATP-binding protein [Deltaproteobacteria bacterium]